MREARIVLTTFNARYSHPALGLRYLLANLGDLQPAARLLEFEIKADPAAAAQQILDLAPQIVGLGVYIWNVPRIETLAAYLKAERPDLVLVLGGPEIGPETEQQPLGKWADYLVCGEADLAFPALCRDLLAGRPPPHRLIRASPADPAQLALPDAFYSEDDLAHKNVYVESSRGCPFLCDYCLSAGDAPVRFFPLDRVMESLQRLLERGALRFKFVDRTFNLQMDRCRVLLSFFLERLRPGLFVHFEMVPDILPDELGHLLARFPAGSLQLEIGVQTFNPTVAERIHRRLDPEAVEQNLRFLREQTKAILHTDLIAGLPGENLDSFAAGFNRLLGLDSHKIQVGILKKLRGAPISRHTEAWRMEYNERPPYEVLSTSVASREEVVKLKRFSRYWELITHHDRFPQTAPLLWEGSDSPFVAFLEASEWLFTRFGRDHSLPLLDLSEGLFDFLTTVRGFPPKALAERMLHEYQAPGRHDVPPFLHRGNRTSEPLVPTD